MKNQLNSLTGTEPSKAERSSESVSRSKCNTSTSHWGAKEKNAESCKDTRAYWRERNRLQRDAMSEEQKEAIRLRANELRRQKRWLT
ncbi:hypothetical protein PoB_007050900 [Plakobranchus ocellatus]|uniref:Uncharacterized protein n=1 Tax=Plakobranchus ocellatus TaxID=259542 RepID=A0AAV4DIJ1_9GAST|nr:hypothetical protein PoB_007050900 [Plakobranchus ocellatus]